MKNILDNSQLFPAVLIVVISYFNIFFIIYAVIGFAKAHLNFNAPFLQYANEAVYPFYILHQTVMVIIGFYIIQWDTSISIKFLFISCGTFLITLVIYEYVIKRYSFTRLVFGLKPISKKIPDLVLT